MKIRIAGHPLHTRSLVVAIHQRGDGNLGVRADLIDLRKCGFVPVASDLQMSGVIHHMQLDAVVDPATRVLERIQAIQPVVAFESSERTGGESCRGPIERIRALEGERVDAHFDERLRAEIGGPRGCSHVLTLAHLLGATTAWALDRPPQGSAWSLDCSPHGGADWASGERVFHRSLVIDGHEVEEGVLQLALQLGDLAFAPAAALARPMDRFAEQREIRLLAQVDLQSAALVRVEGAERRRAVEEVDTAQWRPLGDVLDGLVGQTLLSGMARALLDRLGGRDGDRPLLAGLLNLAPTFLQCMAALSEDWPQRALASPARMGTGGFPDSCYMWRRDGVLGRALAEEVEAGSDILSARRKRSRDS